MIPRRLRSTVAAIAAAIIAHLAILPGGLAGASEGDKNVTVTENERAGATSITLSRPGSDECRAKITTPVVEPAIDTIRSEGSWVSCVGEQPVSCSLEAAVQIRDDSTGEWLEYAGALEVTDCPPTNATSMAVGDCEPAPDDYRYRDYLRVIVTYADGESIDGQAPSPRILTASCLGSTWAAGE